MRFDDDQVDTSGLDDRRGMSRGTAVGAGAGGLGLIALIIVLLLGGDLTAFTEGGEVFQPSARQTSPVDLASKCSNAAAIANNDDCFVLKTFNETTEVWQQQFAVAGQTYRPPRLVYFNGGTTTGGCGAAQAAMGPFYCPADQRVYFDLGFLNELQRNFGADGRYAQAYIVAHEVGHHIQNITGIEAQVRKAQQRTPSKANAYSVRLELQADCLAGVWGRQANDNGNLRISEQEYQQALTAAAAVGDDRIMSGAGMKVNPEKFTHGSAAQRQEWFQRGYESGRMSDCDTFSR